MMDGVSCLDEKEIVNKMLVEGKRSATRLQSLLQESCRTNHRCVSPDELVDNILTSFSDALSVLCSSYEPGELCQNLASSIDDSGMSECSDESRKRPANKDHGNKRGCYKRKRAFESWTTITPRTEDGQAWRKYGQKDILNAKYPRSYYRCTHKYDRGCKATKQVQRIEDNPKMYQTTYIGYHTCTKNVLTKDSDSTTKYDTWESSNMIRFDAEISRSENDHPIVISSLPPPKQEAKGLETPILPSEVLMETNKLSSLESFIWKDLLPIDSSKVTMEYGTVFDAIYHEKVTLQCNLDTDFGVNFIDFDNNFGFY